MYFPHPPYTPVNVDLHPTPLPSPPLVFPSICIRVQGPGPGPRCRQAFGPGPRYWDIGGMGGGVGGRPLRWSQPGPRGMAPSAQPSRGNVEPGTPPGTAWLAVIASIPAVGDRRPRRRKLLLRWDPTATANNTEMPQVEWVAGCPVRALSGLARTTKVGRDPARSSLSLSSSSSSSSPGLASRSPTPL